MKKLILSFLFVHVFHNHFQIIFNSDFKYVAQFMHALRKWLLNFILHDTTIFELVGSMSKPIFGMENLILSSNFVHVN